VNNKKNQFIFNWILKNKLAIGNTPKEENDIFLLTKNGVKNILALCSPKEMEWNSAVPLKFRAKRIILPDSRTNKLPTFIELKEAYNALENFLDQGVTFVHCYASLERSPMLCILYIMKCYKISLEEALDYVLRKHSYSKPTNQQLNKINKFQKKYN